MAPAKSPTTWEERMETKIDDIHKVIHGNGKLGIRVRLILVEVGIIVVLACHGVNIMGISFKF